MAENIEGKLQKEDYQYGDALGIRLVLNSLKNSRNSLNRLIRMYADGKITHVQFKALVYAFSHLITYYKIEKEEEILERLKLIEDKVGIK
jgi:hypothetical protein